MTDDIVTATNDTFDTLIETPTGIPVLVDFWAEWCGPCKALAPTLDEIAKDYAGRLTVAKLDIVANEAVSARLNVQSIPLLVLYRNGEEVGRSLGAMGKNQLSAFIDQYVS